MKETFLHIDRSEKRADLPDNPPEDHLCPHCRSENIEVGFGLAGGGYGVYHYCEDCGQILSKSVEPDE